ncbi:hypothetical protein LB553_27990 [Mesorhizobium sp. CA8]|uniref:hypothetical protein n=1 Tax=Mesorhizobium sp. CA8 TaxID=2876637 RepID=UPI001CCFCD87|nr:hypothetical protein [Mesorhizobium sp. CA8]MBZ9764680.1 hypothetical protein [Mesorhizobium sp. CA8]
MARHDCARARRSENSQKARAKMSTYRLPGRPAGGRSRPMEVKMDNLFLAIWGKPERNGRRLEEFWLNPPVLGFGRLAAAIAIIGVATCLLDHAATAGKTDTVASYNASTKGSSK